MQRIQGDPQIVKRIVSAVLVLAMAACLNTGVYAAGDNMNNANTILASMSLEEKIAQTFMVDFRTWNGRDMTVLPAEVADALTKYKFGSFILFANNVKTTGDTLALTKALQEAAMKDGGLPMLITTDQEGGSVVRLGSGTPLPGNMALAASGNPENARNAGRIIGQELLALGINCTLAPVLDVNCNANNPVIGLRSFSDDPDIVAEFGIAVCEGLDESGAVGCLKHFPGHGDTAVDSHYGLPLVDRSYEELKKRELVPFAEAVENGAEMVMTAHILYPQVDSSKIYSAKTGRMESRPATMSHVIITDILKGEMGFKGVVCTDALNMAGVSANFGEVQAAVEALSAGADLLCMPAADIGNASGLARFDTLINGIKKAVEDGTLPAARLDDAVKRILTLKINNGILEYDADSLTEEKAAATLGNAGFKDYERQMAGEAATLVRNTSSAVPVRLTSESKVLLMCPYANECEPMMRGFAAASRKIPAREKPEAKTYQFSSSDCSVQGKLLESLKWADTVIINSEISSAAKMQYSSWLSAGVKNVTEYCKKNGKTCIVVSVDKPYDVQLYPDASAVLAVYGDKGTGPNLSAGVEAALGAFNIQGTLPVDIPKFDAASGKYTSEIVYPRGSGIKIDVDARNRINAGSRTASLLNGSGRFTSAELNITRKE